MLHVFIRPISVKLSDCQCIAVLKKNYGVIERHIIPIIQANLCHWSCHRSALLIKNLAKAYSWLLNSHSAPYRNLSPLPAGIPTSFSVLCALMGEDADTAVSSASNAVRQPAGWILAVLLGFIPAVEQLCAEFWVTVWHGYMPSCDPKKVSHTSLLSPSLEMRMSN